MRIDLKGHPFVGPAGRLLDRTIADAGLDRRAIFVTNEAAARRNAARYRRRKTIMGYCQIRTASFGNIFSVTRAVE
jgi:uracil-DNA glycosylase family 4